MEGWLGFPVGERARRGVARMSQIVAESPARGKRQRAKPGLARGGALAPAGAGRIGMAAARGAAASKPCLQAGDFRGVHLREAKALLAEVL